MASIVAIILIAFCAKLTQPAVIDFDCKKNDLPPGSCFNGEPIDFGDGDTFNFRGVSDYNCVLFFKLLSTANSTTIPVEIFDKFPNVLHLSLEIGLRNLTSSALERAGKLKSLILKLNFIRILKSDVFSKTSELEEINMENNLIAAVEDGTFDGLDKLQILNLYGNYITVLRQSMFTGAINLRNLNVGFNALEAIEEGALNLPKLEEILIFNNKIKHLPNTVFAGAPKLLNLDMKQNLLESIGEAFFTLPNLHQLQLGGNDRLTNVSVLAFAAMPALNYLGLENIGLRDIASQNIDPNAISAPLTTLSLSHNRLSATDFLSKISVFKKLEKIYVDQNEFIQWDNADVINIKKMFPHVDLVVTKSNRWDKQWMNNVLIPNFRGNRVYCDQFKYLEVYIFNENEPKDVPPTVDGDECLK